MFGNVEDGSSWVICQAVKILYVLHVYNMCTYTYVLYVQKLAVEIDRPFDDRPPWQGLIPTMVPASHLHACMLRDLLYVRVSFRSL